MEPNLEQVLESLHNEEKNLPSSVDFVVKEDFVSSLPVILSNIEQIKQWAIERTKTDRSLVLQTDEDFEKAKSRCAEINKVIESIETKRKEVKKSYHAPYEIFESSLKEVTGILSEAKDNLWGQVKEADEKRKAEKGNAIELYYEKSFPEKLKKIRCLPSIMKKSWLNKSTRLETVFKEIDQIANDILSDIQAIRQFGEEDGSTIGLYYSLGHSLADSITFLQKEKEKDAKAIFVKKEVPLDVIEEPTVNIDFRVECTPTKLKMLKEFLIKNHIKYRKLKEKGEE